jgi:hypothetical protein
VKGIVIEFYKIFQERQWDVGNTANIINVDELKIKTSTIVKCVTWSQFLQHFLGAQQPKETGKS